MELTKRDQVEEDEGGEQDNGEIYVSGLSLSQKRRYSARASQERSLESSAKPEVPESGERRGSESGERQDSGAVAESAERRDSGSSSLPSSEDSSLVEEVEAHSRNEVEVSDVSDFVCNSELSFFLYLPP